MLVAGPAHDVGHGKKVGLEAELTDQRQLMLKRLAHRRWHAAGKAPQRALLGKRTQPAGGGVAGGHDLFGVSVAQLVEREGAARGDGQRARQPICLMVHGSAWIVPAELHQPLRQDALLLKRGQGQPAATALLTYLRSEPARAIMRSHGYGF